MSRCGVGEPGGRALFDALAHNTTLFALDASWNAMRADAARVSACDWNSLHYQLAGCLSNLFSTTSRCCPVQYQNQFS